MQSQPKSFWSNGGRPLIAGLALALVSVIVSVVPIATGRDPFLWLMGADAKAHLLAPGNLLGLAYFVVVAALIGNGVYRLMEAFCESEEPPVENIDTSRMHPIP